MEISFKQMTRNRPEVAWRQATGDVLQTDDQRYPGDILQITRDVHETNALGYPGDGQLEMSNR
jgi:hypothetical protein